MNMYLIVQAAFYSYCLPPSKSYAGVMHYFCHIIPREKLYYMNNRGTGRFEHVS
jgi:hypothetical protein